MEVVHFSHAYKPNIINLRGKVRQARAANNTAFLPVKVTLSPGYYSGVYAEGGNFQSTGDVTHTVQTWNVHRKFD